MNLRKILTEFRDTSHTKRSSLAECEGKIVGMIINIREGLIHELDRRYAEDGYSPHITREVVLNKFNEL